MMKMEKKSDKNLIARWWTLIEERKRIEESMAPELEVDEKKVEGD